jgi:hypothetical protein
VSISSFLTPFFAKKRHTSRVKCGFPFSPPNPILEDGPTDDISDPHFAATPRDVSNRSAIRRLLPEPEDGNSCIEG